ncbi:MAG: hypothetical protein QM727_03940 [Niabella sp.]
MMNDRNFSGDLVAEDHAFGAFFFIVKEGDAVLGMGQKFPLFFY